MQNRTQTFPKSSIFYVSATNFIHILMWYIPIVPANFITNDAIATELYAIEIYSNLLFPTQPLKQGDYVQSAVT